MPKTETAETGRGAAALAAGAYMDSDIEVLVEEDRIPFVLEGLSSGRGWRIGIPPVGSTSMDDIVRRNRKPVFIAPDGTVRGSAIIVSVSKQEAEQLPDKIRRARFMVSQKPLGISEKTA